MFTKSYGQQPLVKSCCVREPTTAIDRYAVAVVKSSTIRTFAKKDFKNLLSLPKKRWLYILYSVW